MKDTEPFSFAGSDTGVLVLHGFTGSTQSMRYLGQELNRGTLPSGTRHHSGRHGEDWLP